MNAQTVSSRRFFDGRLLKLDVRKVELDNGRRARREIREETGYAVKPLTPLGFIFTAPGFGTERITIFYAALAPRNAGQAENGLDFGPSRASGSNDELSRAADPDELHQGGPIFCLRYISSKAIFW